jgi:hypothetical protein
MKVKEVLLNEFVDKKLSSRTKVFNKLINRLKIQNKENFKNILYSSWLDFVEIAKEKNLESRTVRILNKGFGTHYKNLDEISNLELKDSTPELKVNETFSEWFKNVKQEAFPTLAFYPALTIWLEVDKLFKGQDVDALKITVYATLWVFLVSGRYVIKKQKQNKENIEKTE